MFSIRDQFHGVIRILKFLLLTQWGGAVFLSEATVTDTSQAYRVPPDDDNMAVYKKLFDPSLMPILTSRSLFSCTVGEPLYR